MKKTSDTVNRRSHGFVSGVTGRKSVLYIAVVTAVLLAGGAAVWFLTRKKPLQSAYPVVAVEPVGTSDVNIYGEYVGRIRAQQFVEVRARVEGYLQKMFFEEGTRIKKGQTLFVIDPSLYRARVEKARAQLNKAKAQEQKADRDLKRAEMTLGYTTVTSPADGYISERSADIGTLVGPGGKSLLATIVNSDTVRVDFAMTSLEYLRSRSRNVRLGERDSNRQWDPYVTITMADGTVYPYRGLVDFASPQVNPTTGTFSVRAEMPNPDHILLPGEFTKVKLLMDVRKDAIQVPAKALDIEKGGAYVYVVRPDSVVERRFVETGPEVDNNMIVERGLAAGEWIVTEGYHKLHHGIKVAPVAPHADAKTAE